jgi:hypothetical protein
MALFARSKETLLRRFLRLENAIPSHDTSSRVFRALDPDAFEHLPAVHGGVCQADGIKLTGAVAVDGKAVRGTYERSKSSTPLHMVNVFAVASAHDAGLAQSAGPQRGARSLWKYCRCFCSTAAPLPPTRCIAIEPLPAWCSSGPAIPFRLGPAAP